MSSFHDHKHSDSEVESTSSGKRIKAKQPSRVFRVAFRYTVKEDNKENDNVINGICKDIFSKYIYQLENTITDGRNNYHYQGYGNLKTKQRWVKPPHIQTLSRHVFIHGINLIKSLLCVDLNRLLYRSMDALLELKLGLLQMKVQQLSNPTA